MMKRYFDETFSISFQTLGLFRIGIGLLLFCDLFTRILYGYDLIAPDGVLPISQALKALEGKSIISLFFLNDQHWFFNALLILSAFSHLCYLLGYKEKVFGFISFLLLFSIQNRNPFVLHGGDILLRMFLLISLFLPLEQYSIKPKKIIYSGRYSSFGTITLFMQIGLMYFFSALYKSGPEWLSGSALFYVFKNDWISNSRGQFLSQFPGALSLITWGTILFELLVLPAIFISFKRTALRWILFIILFTFHFSIFLVMDIGTFPFVGMLGSFIFYPGKYGLIFSDYKCGIKNSLITFILSLIIICNGFFYFCPEGRSLIKSFFINSGVYQKWSMFSPTPAKTKMQFENENMMDLKKKFSTHHWQKFFMQMSRPKNSFLGKYFAEYLCQKNQLQNVKIILREVDLETENYLSSRTLISTKCDKNNGA